MTVDLADTTDVSSPLDERDPSFVEAVERAIQSEMASQRTACPGVVQSYNAETQRAQVQAAVQLRLADGTTIAEPMFVSVPVVFPGAGGFSISWPLTAGDEVLVVFGERSMDEWLAAGGYGKVAQDVRRFDARDAVAIPGLRSAPGKLNANEAIADTLTISSNDGATRIEVRAGGVVTITADEVRLGGDAAAFLALAQAVNDNFGALRTAFNAHTHISAAPGVATATPLPILGAFADTSTTKAKGV